MSYSNQQIAKQIADLLNKNKIAIFQKGKTSNTGINKEISVTVDGKVVKALGWNVSTPGEVTVFWDTENKRYVAWKEQPSSLKRTTILANRKTRGIKKYLWEYFIKVLQPNSIEGFDADVVLGLNNYDVVGITNTGNSYIVFLNQNYKVFVATGTNTYNYDLTSQKISYSDYDFHGGNILRGYNRYISPNYEDEVENNNLPNNYYDSGGSNNMISGSGFIYAVPPNYNIYFLSEITTQRIPYVLRYPGLAAGLGGGNTFLSDGIETVYFGIPMTRFPCQDGFTISSSGTYSKTKEGEYGSFENEESSFTSNGSAKIGHSYTSFGYRALSGRTVSHSYTWNCTREGKMATKIELTDLSLNGLIPQDDLYSTEEYIDTYSEDLSTEAYEKYTIESQPRTDPITIENVGGFIDVYTGGGNDLTWENLIIESFENTTQSMNYTGSFTKTQEIPFQIYDDKVIYLLENITRTDVGSSTLTVNKSKLTDKSTTPITVTNTLTETLNGTLSYTQIDQVKKWDNNSFIQGLNCFFGVGYSSTITRFSEITITRPPVYPTVRIRSFLNGVFQNVQTSYGYGVDQLGRTNKNSITLVDDSLNSEYPNFMSIYVKNNEYLIKHREAGLSLSFITKNNNVYEYFDDVEINTTINISLTNYNLNLYRIGICAGWSALDKDLVTSSGSSYTDFYPYTLSTTYTYEYEDTSNDEAVWLPVFGTRSPYQFVVTTNPHWVANYDGIEVDIFLKQTNGEHLHCIGILHINYQELETTDNFNNTYTYTNLDNGGYDLEITEIVGIEYVAIPSYYVENNEDSILVISRDNYTSWICTLADNFYDISSNLYITNDDKLELSVVERKNTINLETLRVDIYQFNTTSLKWERKPNVTSLVSSLSEVSNYLSYHPTPSNSRKKKKKPPRS